MNKRITITADHIAAMLSGNTIKIDNVEFCFADIGFKEWEKILFEASLKAMEVKYMNK